MKRLGRDRHELSAEELSRTDHILQRALTLEQGGADPAGTAGLTEDHPDGRECGRCSDSVGNETDFFRIAACLILFFFWCCRTAS